MDPAVRALAIQLATQMRKADRPTAKGVVISIQGGTPPTLTVNISGTHVPGVMYLQGYQPRVNDVVVMFKEGSEYCVINTYATAAPLYVNDLSVRGGVIVTGTRNGDEYIDAQIDTTSGNNQLHDVRQPCAHRIDHSAAGGFSITGVNEVIATYDFTPVSDCWPLLSMTMFFDTTEGLSGLTIEPSKAEINYRLRTAPAGTVHYTSPNGWWTTPLAHDSWNTTSSDMVTINELIPFKITAGTEYRLEIRATKTSNLAPVYWSAHGVIAESVRIT